MDKKFIFTIDDNIRFLRECNEKGYKSIFDHPYPNLLKRLHEKYSLKIQLNLFYKDDYFNLGMMQDRYRDEFKENADWLKLSFHSEFENVHPYREASFGKVRSDAQKVNSEIVRFAGERSLAKTTTVHYCTATDGGILAIFESGYRGLLGLYGSDDAPRTSYRNTEEEAKEMRLGKMIRKDGISYHGIDIVLNRFGIDEIKEQLAALRGREIIKVMIHEQYFYQDYKAYQADFEMKLDCTFSALSEYGYGSVFFEDII